MDHSLTFCICAYNAEKYIEETLESLFKQTFLDFNLWIIDDCSTDRTRKVAENYCRLHAPINYSIISLSQNGGLANARRYAETHVTSEFIGFIDADDIAKPEALGKMFKTIQNHPDCMTVGVYCQYISPESTKMSGGIFIGPRSKEEFMAMAQKEKMIFLPPLNISRTEFIRKAGFRAIDGFPPGKPRFQDMCEDLDLWTRMSDFYKEGKYMLVIPEILLNYRKMNSSMSVNVHAMNMRMRHIKKNLKLRRAGKREQKFIDYLLRLTLREKIIYAYQDWATNFYKRAGFYYIQKDYLRFIFFFFCTGIFYPKYLLQKFKKNIFPFLKNKSFPNSSL